MVYICVIPQRIAGARRIIPPSDWDSFRQDLEAHFPLETRIEFEEPTPLRPAGWIFAARPRPGSGIPVNALYLLYHDISVGLDGFIAEHAKPEPTGAP